MTRLPLSGLLAFCALLTAAGCQRPPRQPANQAAAAACRVEVDRVYAAQNRVDLSRRDEVGTPFAGSSIPGITSSGLGSQFHRQNMMRDCINASEQDQPQTGAAPAPAAPALAPPSRPRQN